MTSPENSELVRVSDVSKDFLIERGFLTDLAAKFERREKKVLHAVRNVSISIKKGETLGLVGESSCGKSTLGKCILRIIDPTTGDIWFEGKNITNLDLESLRRVRPRMQMVFQDPYSSLNPRKTVRQIVGHSLEVGGIPRSEREAELRKLMETVGLNVGHLDKYPHQFSGGQKQRIAIARALAPSPTFIVADEPVSALDVSVQSQIVNLIRNLQRSLGLTILFITHDLSTVEYISNTVAVMYMGKIVESGPTSDLFHEPLHPYTTALLSAVPIPNPRLKRQRIVLTGDPPSPLDLPSGCTFQTRCPHVKEICRNQEPNMIEVRSDHRVACHLFTSS